MPELMRVFKNVDILLLFAECILLGPSTSECCKRT